MTDGKPFGNKASEDHKSKQTKGRPRESFKESKG
jgi:hypothetical protein